MNTSSHPLQNKFTKRPMVLAIALALSTSSAFSANYYWIGQGVDAISTTTGNWGAVDGTPLVDVPVLGGEDFLYFGSTPAIPVQTLPQLVDANLDADPATTAPVAIRGLVFNVDTTLGGDTLALQETLTSPTQALINATNADVVIDNDMIIKPRLTNSTLKEQVDITANNSSVTLNGNITAQPNILIAFNAQNNSSLNINGVVNAPALSLSGTTTMAGENGSIRNEVANADPLLPPVAVEGSIELKSAAKLILDNAADANSDRIGNSMDVTLSANSALSLIGNAVTAVTEKIGDLVISSPANLVNDQVVTLGVNSSGADTVLEVDKITFNKGTQSTYYSPESKSRLDITSNVALGASAKIKVTDTSGLTNVSGILNNITVNSKEFAVYDAVNGLKAATTKNDFVGAVATDNVYVNANQALANDTAIKSLALGADVTGSSANTITVASGKVLVEDDKSVAIAQKLAFGGAKADITALGDAVINGGVTGTNGMVLSGGGQLTLGASGTMTGQVIVSDGTLNLVANNALQGSDIRVYDVLNIGSTTQSVKTLNVGYDDYGKFFGNGVINATGDITLNASTIDATLNSSANVHVHGNVVNGVINAKTVLAHASVHNGNIVATDSISLSGTANGVLAGAAQLNGSGTLTNTNTYTGNTDGLFTLTGNGSILNSASIDGAMTLNNDSTHAVLNRIGDNAAIKGNLTVAAAADAAAYNVTENVGIIIANAESNQINLSNASGGTTTLQADTLSINNGGYLFVNKDANSRLRFDVGPSFIVGTNVVAGALTKSGSGGFSWSTYNAATGLEAIAVNTGSLAATASNQFVRIANSADGQLNGDTTVLGVDVDTTDTLNGSGTLTLSTGQLLLSQSNAINYSAINFTNKEGLVSVAGTNTITSQLQGTAGFQKIGDGKLILENSTAFTGSVKISGGQLQVNSGTFNNGNAAGMTIAQGAKLILSGDGKLNSDTDVGYSNGYGAIDLVNNASQTFTSYASLQANIAIDATSSLSSSGYIERVNNAGSFTNNGQMWRLDNSATASNAGSVYYLNNSAGGVITNSGSVKESATNSGLLNNGGTIKSIWSNSGTVNNNGTITDGFGNDGTINNTGTLNATSNSYNSSAINNNTNASLIISTGDILTGSGTINNKGTVTVDLGGKLQNNLVQKDSADAITTINGSYLGNMEIKSGILKGTGVIDGNVIVSGTGHVKPGNSPGLLAINGDFNLLSGGILEMEINSLGAFDTLQVSGNVSLLGKVLFKLGDGLDKSIFDKDASGNAQFSVEDFFQGAGGGSLELAVLQDINIALADSSGNSLGGLTIGEDGSVSNVPVPGAAWLMGSGLLGLAGIARRKKVH